jgi:hypothetical protein
LIIGGESQVNYRHGDKSVKCVMKLRVWFSFSYLQP